jgi:integrase
MAINTAMRWRVVTLNAALGLQWGDIDLEEGMLRIRRALQRFGDDSAARKPLLAERTRLLKALAEVEEKETDAQEVNILSKDLARVRNALKAVKTQVQVVEPSPPGAAEPSSYQTVSSKR